MIYCLIWIALVETISLALILKREYEQRWGLKSE